MNKPNKETTGFTDSQKQFISGFAMGTDVARAIRGLPIIAGSADRMATGSMITLGGKVNASTKKTIVSPDALARSAQDAVIASGRTLSKEEQAKREKNGLDLWDEIEARSRAAEFPKGTDVFLQKFHGLFHVAPAQNSYMCRMRIPGGQIRSWQARGLADLADRCAGGYVDVTTRANLQYREIPAGQASEVLYGLRELEIISLGSGSDNIRNCTASCLSGIDSTELIETLPLAKRMHHYILNHREMYGLPRKFNIAFDGGGKISALDDTNDIGFHAVEIQSENASETFPAGVYFQLTLGGITGHKDFARYTGVLLQPHECIEVAAAIVRVFIRTGDRTDRKKSRLKYVLDSMGFDQFIAEVETELGRQLNRMDADFICGPQNEDRLAHVGFHRQKQAGLYYVGIVCPVGRITSEQLRSLGDIANQYGNGELRLTVWQNVILTGVVDANIPAMKKAITEIGLGYEATAFRAGVVACTGNAGCKFAASDTKRNAMQIATLLESRFELDQPINIHVTGCHHSCAQHYIGDIGLLGCKVEKGDDMVEGYHVHLGGGWGENQAIGRLLFESVAMDEVPELLASIIGGYLQKRNPEETFVRFIGRFSNDEIRQLALATVP
jgi:ferredoxin-nitrite reductase